MPYRDLSGSGRPRSQPAAGFLGITTADMTLPRDPPTPPAATTRVAAPARMAAAPARPHSHLHAPPHLHDVADRGQEGAWSTPEGHSAEGLVPADL